MPRQLFYWFLMNWSQQCFTCICHDNCAIVACSQICWFIFKTNEIAVTWISSEFLFWWKRLQWNVASTHWNWMQFSVISNWFHHINTLTHCSLVARYWITELSHHIGSGNVMLPVWCQAITWTNDDFTFFLIYMCRRLWTRLCRLVSPFFTKVAK